jgi:Mechanosensitive ion channel, conserved TM helix
MEMNWRAILMASYEKFLGKVVTFLPNLLVMVAIFIFGFFGAWVVKILLLRFLRAIQFDKFSERWGLTRMLSQGGRAFSPAHLLSRFFYWVIVIITLILGVNALEIGPTQIFATHFFNYLPHIFAAILILVVGYLIAVFLSQAALIAAVNAQIGSARLLSRAVRWFLITLSLAMALYHLGIAETVVVAAFSITLGGIALALAIAFGWGGRDLAKNFLENLTRRKEKEGEEQDRISHI